jgi:hypothetical protein
LIHIEGSFGGCRPGAGSLPRGGDTIGRGVYANHGGFAPRYLLPAVQETFGQVSTTYPVDLFIENRVNGRSRTWAQSALETVVCRDIRFVGVARRCYRVTKEWA